MNYRELGAAERIRTAAATGVDRILELALTTNLELDLATIRHGGTITTYSPERADPQLPAVWLMRVIPLRAPSSHKFTRLGVRATYLRVLVAPPVGGWLA